MRIRELFDGGGPVFSFEFFPPKSERGEDALFHALEELRPLSPSFVSVTYGAGGSTRERTVRLTSRIKREIGIEAMAHLTCVEQSRDDLAAVLDRLDHEGIENVLALRGDPPAGAERFERPRDGFAHASELVRFIRSRWSFCVGGACYPECHVEAESPEADLLHLKEKVDEGVDFLITQLFFDNDDYFAFVGRARAIGIEVPIVPGIMPVTDAQQLRRFTQMCGARIPDDLEGRLREVGDDREAVGRVGVEHAARQCIGLLEGGAPGIHFYTLNKSPATRSIFARLRRRRVV